MTAKDDSPPWASFGSSWSPPVRAKVLAIPCQAEVFPACAACLVENMPSDALRIISDQYSEIRWRCVNEKNPVGSSCESFSRAMAVEGPSRKALGPLNESMVFSFSGVIADVTGTASVFASCEAVASRTVQAWSPGLMPESTQPAPRLLRVTPRSDHRSF